LWAISTKGRKGHSDAVFAAQDYIVFGPETRGLPRSLLEALGEEKVLRIPMLKDSRSMNLSNAASVIVYEAWRQLGYRGSSSQ